MVRCPRLTPVAVALVAACPPTVGLAKVSVDVERSPVAAGTGASILQGMFGLSQGDAATAGAQLDDQINGLIPQLTDSFISSIDQSFAGLDTQGVLRAMANAAGGAGKLTPMDYASDAAVASLSVGAGVTGNGWSTGDLHHLSIDAGDGQLPQRGLGASAGAALTFHLRTLDLPRWRYFDPSRLSVGVSYMTFGPHRFGDDVTVKLQNWGLRAAYQLLPGHSWSRRGLARWGGLNVGLGLAKSSLAFDFRGTLPAQTAVQQVDGDVPLDMRLIYSGDARLAFDLGAWNVPLEITTHLQLGYLFTLFGGLGLDYNRATASLDGALTSSGVVLEAVDRDDPSIQPRVISQPSASLNAADRALGAAWDLRSFLGVQLNLLYVAVFAQASVDTTGNLSANAGLRLFY